MKPRLFWKSLAALTLAFALVACGGTSDGGDASDDAHGGGGGDAVGGRDGLGGDVRRGDGGGGGAEDIVVDSPWGVDQVLPSKGSAYGGDLVALAGRGFADGVRVWFGEEEGNNVLVVTDTYLEVRTPRGPVGLTDVRVEWPDTAGAEWPRGTSAVLEDGFLFELPVRVLTIDPAEGPLDGGTPVVVRGEGFPPDARLVIGGRQALEVRVSDARTLVALTPPGVEAGPVDVHVGGANGFGVLRAGFAYRAKARLDKITPPFGPTTGGEAAALSGAGLDDATGAFFGGIRAPRLIARDAGLDATTPAGSVGPVAVAVSTPWTTAVREGGYVYVAPNAPQEALALLGAVPPDGSTSGGERVTLVVQGLRGVGPAAVEVTIGGRAATVVGVGTVDVRIDTPPGDVGPADVKVTTPQGTTTLAGGFTYVAPLVVRAVEPNGGPAAGGNALVIEGVGFAAGVDEVRVGALAASGVRVASDGRIDAVAPPGTAGRVDVVVRHGSREARLVGAYEYRSGSPVLVALDPTSGSVSGGTNVHLFGSGFGSAPTILFDTRTAQIVDLVDDGHIVVRTPDHPQGTVDVTVARGTDRSTLPSAFTFFSPDAGSGGTWGAAVSGTVNVVVLDVFTEEGIEGAYVTLGDPATSPHKGLTDAAGRITFSGGDLTGRQEVSAAHAKYSAASVVAFDAENVTLLLYPHFPPNIGPPPDFSNLGPGRVTGKVLWDDKYRLLPYGDCGVVEPDGVLCQPCASDDDCAPEGVCTRIGQTGRYCTLPCSVLGADGTVGANHDVCPERFSCTHMGAPGFQCIPMAGDVIIRCETTRPYPGGQVPPPGAGMLVGADMLYSIVVRLEELAVVCVASQQKVPLGPAEPFLMGVRRHIQVESRQSLVQQDVVLDIPLRSTMRVRLDEAPLHPLGDDVWMVTTYLDFGAEGVWQMRAPVYGAQGDDLYSVPNLPPGFPGTLSGASFALAVTQFSRFDSESHFSKAWKWGIADMDDDSLLRWDGERWHIEEMGDALDARGLAVDAQGRVFAVGDAGRVTRREGGVWFVEATPTKSPLYATVIAADGHVYAAGSDGALLRRGDTGWRLVAAAPSETLYALSPAPGDGVVVAGDRGVAGRIEDDVFVPFATDTDVPLYAALALAPDDVWLAGLSGVVRHVTGDVVTEADLPEALTVRALAQAPDGAVLALTEGGGAFRRDGDAWWEEETGVSLGLRAATVVDDALFVVGDRGVILRRDGADAWSDIRRPDYHADLRAVVKTPDGAAFAAGLHSVLVAPILAVPRFETLERGALSGLTATWDVPPSSSPTIQYLSIVSNAGYPLWDVFLEPDVTAVELPDFQTLAGFDPLIDPTLYLTLQRIYHPSLDIDRFTFWDVWFGEFWPAISETTVLLR